MSTGPLSGEEHVRMDELARKAADLHTAGTMSSDDILELGSLQARKQQHGTLFDVWQKHAEALEGLLLRALAEAQAMCDLLLPGKPQPFARSGENQDRYADTKQLTVVLNALLGHFSERGTDRDQDLFLHHAGFLTGLALDPKTPQPGDVFNLSARLSKIRTLIEHSDKYRENGLLLQVLQAALGN